MFVRMVRKLKCERSSGKEHCSNRQEETLGGFRFPPGCLTGELFPSFPSKTQTLGGHVVVAFLSYYCRLLGL